MNSQLYLVVYVPIYLDTLFFFKKEHRYKLYWPLNYICSCAVRCRPLGLLYWWQAYYAQWEFVRCNYNTPYVCLTVIKTGTYICQGTKEIGCIKLFSPLHRNKHFDTSDGFKRSTRRDKQRSHTDVYIPNWFFILIETCLLLFLLDFRLLFPSIKSVKTTSI